jgi:hypothetical protein
MKDKSPQYSWIDFILSKEKCDRHSSHDDDYFSFTVHRGYEEPTNIGYIGSTVVFGNTALDKALTINPNEFQAFIMSLVYNKTPVEIDIDSEDDIDNNFDVDD